MSAPARAGTGGTSSPLPLGTVVGGRFRIQTFVRSEAGTDLYQAIDSQGGGAVLLRVVSEAPATRAVLDADLAKVSRLQHKNLTHLVAVGDYAGMLFIAAEAEDGHTLRELIEAQRSQGKTVGLAYGRTLLGHVTHGLEAAYQAMPHGGLNPDRVWVTRAGRVKVSDLGLTRGLPALARKGGPPGAPEGLYLAPEVGRGLAPNAASDVYSLAAILYELVTGAVPSAPLRAPSQAAKGVPPALDAVVARAMAPQPHARFATPVELMNALASMAGSEPAGAAPTLAPELNGVPSGQPPGRITLGKSFDVAQAAGLAETDERWLVQKDRLDYGPFSLAQVMAQIERGDFRAEHVIVDVESGERKKIKEHPLLGEFALEADRRLEKQRRAQAEVAHEHVERKKGRATRLILGSAILALAAGMTYYITQRKAAEDDPLAMRIAEDDIEAFIQNAKFDFTKKKPAPTRRASGKGDEFSNVQNLGDVSQGGGEEILSDNVVQGVMMQNYKKLVPCIMNERHKNSGLSDVDMEFIIVGSGEVRAVKVNGQRSGTFPDCVLNKMKSFRFPSFNGKKTLASWSLSMR